MAENTAESTTPTVRTGYDEVTGEYLINGRHWRHGVMGLMRNALSEQTEGRRSPGERAWRVMVQRVDVEACRAAGSRTWSDYQIEAGYSTILGAFRAMRELILVFGEHWQYVGSQHGMYMLGLHAEMCERMADPVTYDPSIDRMEDDVLTMCGDAFLVDGFVFMVAE